jgi:hypothetical protein
VTAESRDSIPALCLSALASLTFFISRCLSLCVVCLKRLPVCCISRGFVETVLPGKINRWDRSVFFPSFSISWFLFLNSRPLLPSPAAFKTTDFCTFLGIFYFAALISSLFVFLCSGQNSRSSTPSRSNGQTTREALDKSLKLLSLSLLASASPRRSKGSTPRRGKTAAEPADPDLNGRLAPDKY